MHAIQKGHFADYASESVYDISNDIGMATAFRCAAAHVHTK